MSTLMTPSADVVDGEARYVRSEFLRIRESEFARPHAPRRTRRTNHLPPSPAECTGAGDRLRGFGVAAAILTESSPVVPRSGLPLPTASWESSWPPAREHIDYAWWLVLFPGDGDLTTVAAFNIVGERLRDTLDPRSD